MSDTLTVLGIIASGALLLAMECHKNEKLSELTISFLMSGITSLIAVLVGIVYLFPIGNNSFSEISLLGLYLGSLLLSFSVLLIGIIRLMGIIRLDELKKESKALKSTK